MHELLKGFIDDPWWLMPKSMSENLNKELTKELSPSHQLYGKFAVAVARRTDNDDVIFWIDELNKYAVIHLTYSKETSSEFPITTLYMLSELEKHCRNISSIY